MPTPSDHPDEAPGAAAALVPPDHGLAGCERAETELLHGQASCPAVRTDRLGSWVIFIASPGLEAADRRGEAHMERLFAGTGMTFAYDREIVDFHFDSIPATVETYERQFGLIMMVRELLEPQGLWQALRDDLTEMFSRNNAGQTARSTSRPGT
jgi:hypothetical protein